MTAESLRISESISDLLYDQYGTVEYYRGSVFSFNGKRAKVELTSWTWVWAPFQITMWGV